MRQVYVSAGSNVEPEASLRAGMRGLRRHYGELSLSPVYRNRAVGFEGDDFLNLAVGFKSNATAAAIRATLQSIENACGRDRTQPRFGPRTLDLDLLLHGETVLDGDGFRVPHRDLQHAAFVLGPMADLAPGCIHPETGDTLAEMWAAFDRAEVAMMPVAVAL